MRHSARTAGAGQTTTRTGRRTGCGCRPARPAAGADALLRARERAVRRDRRDDARELRRELGLIGVVLRDEDKRQYWRLTTRAVAPGPEQPTSAEREPDGR
ncbi:CysS/YqeB C-terminal domain-containing protein [Micromonospora sp. LH3U1]|uniref:CysS/YqeB C-terminal domain-containing protein n=1 Tax=Micromonospora sp. LH3U1 TaxID=3018339 RepID=UPI003FA5D22A